MHKNDYTFYPSTLELEEVDMDYFDGEKLIIAKQLFDDFIPNCIVNIHWLEEDTVKQYMMIYDTDETIVLHKV